MFDKDNSSIRQIHAGDNAKAAKERIAQAKAATGGKGSYGDLDAGSPNHFNPNKRGFSPK